MAIIPSVSGSSSCSELGASSFHAPILQEDKDKLEEGREALSLLPYEMWQCVIEFAVSSQSYLDVSTFMALRLTCKDIKVAADDVVPKKFWKEIKGRFPFLRPVMYQIEEQVPLYSEAVVDEDPTCNDLSDLEEEFALLFAEEMEPEALSAEVKMEELSDSKGKEECVDDKGKEEDLSSDESSHFSSLKDEFPFDPNGPVNREPSFAPRFSLLTEYVRGFGDDVLMEEASIADFTLTVGPSLLIAPFQYAQVQRRCDEGLVVFWRKMRALMPEQVVPALQNAGQIRSWLGDAQHQEWIEWIGRSNALMPDPDAHLFWRFIGEDGEEEGEVEQGRWDFSQCKLSLLPSEIGRFIGISVLDLRGNDLKALPSEIGKITGLSELYLQDNRLERLPCEIGDLTGLRTLSLLRNDISVLPDEIGNLTNLTDLNLGGNYLRCLPVQIGQLTNLTSLSLNGCALRRLTKEIGKLAALESLYLADNYLRKLPAEIRRFVRLRRLDVENNKLKQVPAQIGQLSNLTYLNLSKNRLHRLPDEMLELTNLRSLDVSNNFKSLLSSLPEAFGGLAHIEWLTLVPQREES